MTAEMLPAAAKTGSSVSSEEPSTGSGLEYKLIGGVNEIFRRSIVKADAILDSAVKLLKKYFDEPSRFCNLKLFKLVNLL